MEEKEQGNLIGSDKVEGTAVTRRPGRFSIMIDGHSCADRISSHGSQFLDPMIPPADGLVLVVLV